MKIESSMNLSDLQKRMGNVATEDDAFKMRELLLSNGYEGMDTSEVGGGVWEAMLNQAIEDQA